MARTVDQMPSSVKRGGHGTRYPWAEWFNGRVWELVQGEDFESNPKNFRAVAATQAYRAGLNFTATVQGDRVFFQATPREVNGE